MLRRIINILKNHTNLRKWESRLLAKEYELLNKEKNIITLTRHALGGFDPTYLDSVLFDPLDSLPAIEDEERALGNEEGFLISAHEVSKNEAVSKLITYIIRNIILFIAKDSSSMEESNFNRASMAGLVLFKEEIDRRGSLYVQKYRKPKEEEYDANEVIG